jgi:hypothetical protein
VLNGGSSSLTGVNTITASARVRVDQVAANLHQQQPRCGPRQHKLIDKAK